MNDVTLVTGGTGFIGSHLVAELTASNRKVRCLARPNSKPLENVEMFYGDLTDPDSLKGINKDVGTVFHLAAIARPMAIPDKEYFRINVEGTRNLLEVFKNHDLKKFIHMSSVSAVGPSRDGRPVDEKTPANPIDVYGQSKLAAEKLVFEFMDMPIVVLRPPMVFGPGDIEMLKLFKMVKTRFFPIRGNENGHFEFCYVGNLVQACLLVEQNGEGIYHVSNGRAYTLREVLSAISRAAGVKLLPVYLPNFLMTAAGARIEFLGKIFGFHPPFSRDTVKWMSSDFWVSDVSKIKRELDYSPRYSLEEGVEKTVKWYREKGYL
jgi:nucleoside-diphosphate-sugar epimerase